MAERYDEIILKRGDFMKIRKGFRLLLPVLLLCMVYLIGVYKTLRRDWPVALASQNIAETIWQLGSHNSPAEQKILLYAEEHGYTMEDYSASVVKLLQRRPETEKFVLEYPEYRGEKQDFDHSQYDDCDSVPLFMQWDPRWGYMNYGEDVAGLTGCGPVSLAMAAVYLTGDGTYCPDYMIDFAIEHGYCVYGQGSSWTLISEGGEELGLDVTELPLDEGRIIANLEVGNPVICVMGPGAFTTTGHFIVLTDYEDGLFTINDPNSYENSEKRWRYEEFSDQIDNLWALRK